MTAPLSTFMTQLLDESINKQGAASTRTLSSARLFDESTSFSTNSAESAHSADLTVMTDNTGAREQQEIPTTKRANLENKEPQTADNNNEKASTSSVPKKAENNNNTIKTSEPKKADSINKTTSAQIVPNKMALKRCRKSMAAVKDPSPLKPTAAADEASLSLASTGTNAASNLLQTSSTSLTNFMTQLLNDSDIDKLILLEGDLSSHSRNLKGDSSLIMTDNAQSNTNSRPSMALSKGAANVLASAVRTIQKEESDRSFRERNNNNSKDNIMKDSSDADGEKSQSTSSRNNNKDTNQQRSSISDLSLEAAKQCLESTAQIDALLMPDNAASPKADPYSLVSTMAKSGGNADLAQMDYSKGNKRKGLQRSNSDTSLSLLSAASKSELQKSSIESLSISGLRQELKKSKSFTQLRQQMTRLQSRENIYADSMELEEGSTNQQEENSKPLGNSVITDDSISISALKAPAKKTTKTRARSTTPRARHRSKSVSATKKRRAKSSTATHDNKNHHHHHHRRHHTTTDTAAVRSPSPALHKKRSASSDQRRGRTPRTPSKSSGRIGRSKRTTSKDHKSRGQSVSARSPSVTPTPRSRCHSATPKTHTRSRSQSKTPRKRRSSDISINKDGSMKETSMKDASMKDASMKRDKSKSRSMRKGMDESSKRDADTGRSGRRTSANKHHEGPKSPSRSTRARRVMQETMAPIAPKTPSVRTKRISIAAGAKRSPSRSRSNRRGTSKDAPRTPKTPKTPSGRGNKTPKTPSSSKRTSISVNKPKKSKSFDTGAVDASGPQTPKVPLRRNKTSDGSSAALRQVRNRNNSMTSISDIYAMEASSKMDGSSKNNSMRRASQTSISDIYSMEASSKMNESYKSHSLRRNRTVGHDSSSIMTPITPSVRRRNSLTAAGLPSTPRRNLSKDGTNDPSTPRRNISKDGINKEPRISRRGGVSATKPPPRRQQSEPVPTVAAEAVLVAEEAAQAAKEMEKRRVRSKSANGKIGGRNKSHNAHAESSKPTNRRGTRQRSNQQAQQVLRHALTEEIKAKETAAAAPAVNVLAAQAPEGVKEATWIARRKSRGMFLSPQPQARITHVESVGGV